MSGSQSEGHGLSCPIGRDAPGEGSTPLYAPLEKQRKINGLQFHTGLRKAARSIDRTAFALYTIVIFDMSNKNPTIPAVDNRVAVLRAINKMFIICQFGDFYYVFTAQFLGYFPAPAVSPFTKNFRKRGYVTRTGTIMITASAILYDSVGIRVAIAPEILSFVARNVALFSRL